MEIQKSQVRSYGYTLRKVKDPGAVTRDMYAKHIERLSKLQGVSFEGVPVYELASGLHCHGVVRIPKGLDTKRLRFRGWHFKLEELYDPQGWYLYLNKGQEDLLPDMIDPPDDSPLPKGRLF